MAGVLPVRERGVCCSVDLEIPTARAEELASVLKALADPTRVQIVLCLRESKEPVCVCDFTATFSISQPTVSHHMAKLREAGLVDATRQGIWTYYRLKPHLPANIRRIIDALA
ncbi:MAG: metalloregulator ArsR/SmtB family transcription factor [Chloroflexi bacterium]|nr:MAG: metalloregulator ArsR/SmtB family transcription factor [Chloroflexota bacterium]TME43721.1 MAG: metalloregulator ArsR/SmtB family transcription factor [Chloroflexota bacterium]